MNVIVDKNSDQKREEAQRQLKIDYEDVFDSPKGQRVLQDIQASGVFLRSAFHVDTHIMAANCAKQDFARHIKDMATRPQIVRVDKPKKAKRSR